MGGDTMRGQSLDPLGVHMGSMRIPVGASSPDVLLPAYLRQGGTFQTAHVRDLAPDFRGIAVINGDFKRISKTDYQGKYLTGGLGGLSYPLLSDLKKEIAEAYGILLSTGVSKKSLFIIDGKGILRMKTDVRRCDPEEVLMDVKECQITNQDGEDSPTIKPDAKGSKEYFQPQKTGSKSD
ncbi:unnamed protein product [Cyprideis torosa]|uniref:thioredoxin-dependent peroxiredoxin n=1 Tax=Cyprideis torosa TaxID=163714 RepID=A0A7R8WNW7_9CRUS|nr:unnamed protein product [Cyprideis torosa]CAG0906707.1 unnamed protein product [Cyprideis torosa]